jgi:hypothetical protein
LSFFFWFLCGPKEEGQTAQGPKEEGQTAQGPKEEGQTAQGPKEEGQTAQGPKEESFFFWPLCCLSFFFWSLCCLSFFDLRILTTSNSFFYKEHSCNVLYVMSYMLCLICNVLYVMSYMLCQYVAKLGRSSTLVVLSMIVVVYGNSTWLLRSIIIFD